MKKFTIDDFILFLFLTAGLSVVTALVWSEPLNGIIFIFGVIIGKFIRIKL